MKKMKKVLAGLLAATMVMSMSFTAFAEGENAGETSNETTTTETNYVLKTPIATYDAVIKAYTVQGQTYGDTIVFPAETLKFTSVAADSNPDTTNLTISDLAVSGATGQKLTINVPEYTKVGTYHYTISETAGSSQGVTYTTGTIAVSVMVTYDYTDTDEDGYHMKATVGITSDNGAKADTFTNTYDLGALDVTKTVTGNLGDKNKEFTVKVTFVAENEKDVKSDITYVDGTETKNITVSAMDDGTETVEITVKDGETVKFHNIPAGVTYSIEENNYTDGDKNGENGYDAPTYTNQTGIIYKGKTSEAGVTNNKSTSVDTGIILDSAPYILLLAFAAMGVFAVVNKKREEEF